MSESNGTGSSGQLGGWWVASALVVAVVVGSLAFVLLRPHPSPSPTTSSTTGSVTSSMTGSETGPATSPAAPGGTATTSSPAAPTASAGSAGTDAVWADTGCNGTSGPVAAPASVMRDVTWAPFLTSAIPSSPTLGPTRTSVPPLRQCFQHSPAGALLAAANIALAQYTPATGSRVVERQYVAGPGQAKALADLASATSPQPGQIVGYQLVGCTASACNVNLAFFGGGVYAAAVVPMVWRGGDWLIDGSRAIPDGGLVAGLPAGFTAWGAGT